MRHHLQLPGRRTRRIPAPGEHGTKPFRMLLERAAYPHPRRPVIHLRLLSSSVMERSLAAGTAPIMPISAARNPLPPGTRRPAPHNPVLGIVGVIPISGYHPEGHAALEDITLHRPLGVLPPQPGQLRPLILTQRPVTLAPAAGISIHPVAQGARV